MGQIALSDFEHLPTQREGGGPGWFYIHVLITTVQLFQKTRRNISYCIKALWSSRKKQSFKKGEGTGLVGGVQ